MGYIKVNFYLISLTERAPSILQIQPSTSISMAIGFEGTFFKALSYTRTEITMRELSRMARNIMGR
jgi:hypothetical protein